MSQSITCETCPATFSEEEGGDYLTLHRKGYDTHYCMVCGVRQIFVERQIDFDARLAEALGGEPSPKCAFCSGPFVGGNILHATLSCPGVRYR